MAGVSRGRNGFQKQKAGEKLAETEEDLLEHRTDGSDAYDTLYIGCENFPQHDVFAFDAGGCNVENTFHLPSFSDKYLSILRRFLTFAFVND